MSEAQKRTYVIADNKLALNAGWDTEMLAIEFGDLAELGFDLSLTGFGDDELASILNSGNPGLTDPDEVPELPKEPVTRPGDVWLLGKHRLVCGDSTNADDVPAGVMWRRCRLRGAGDRDRDRDRHRSEDLARAARIPRFSQSWGTIAGAAL
jgi:hypothetical protein